MTANEKHGMKRFAVFGVSLYIRSWFHAPRAAAAPANDLAWLKEVAVYSDKGISNAAVKAFSRHLWYLSEALVPALVPLSFFDQDTSVSTKRDMVKAMNKIESEKRLHRVTVDVTRSSFSDVTVADFVTCKSMHFFKTLNLETGFLSVDPSDWDVRDDYRKAAEFIHSMEVVNNSAEHGVALMQSYNNILTKNEDQKQYLLQVVK